MNQPKFVQFKKERDLGSMISDTFTFLRSEWKSFYGTILKISIVPIILAIVAIVFFSMTTSDVFSSFGFYDPNGFDEPGFENFASVFGSALLYMVLYLIAYVMVTVSSMYYVKSYIENKGETDYHYVNEQTKKKFWPFVGLFILIGLIMTVGLIFCILPGVYFWVVLSLTSCLLVFEKKGVFDSINDAFNFIKGHWWETFGILLVVSLLVGVMNYITQIPATIYQFVKMGISFGEQDPLAVFDLFEDPIYLLLIGFSYLVSFLLYTVTIITTIFIYFDINEQENASGSIEMIDTLGN